MQNNLLNPNGETDEFMARVKIATDAAINNGFYLGMAIASRLVGAQLAAHPDLKETVRRFAEGEETPWEPSELAEDELTRDDPQQPVRATRYAAEVVYEWVKNLSE